jgi:hypothetical protein
MPLDGSFEPEISDGFGSNVRQAMAQVIVPGHQALYTWRTTQSRSNIQVIIDLPDDIDVNSITVEISESSPCTLVCYIPNELPFIAGRTYLPIADHKVQFDNELFILDFTKQTSAEWPYLIAGPVPDASLLIDPFSAFQLSAIQRVASDAQTLHTADLLLQKAVSANLCPALNFTAKHLVQSGHVAEARRLFEIAAEQHNDAEATAQLGSLAYGERRFADAETYFQRAAAVGHVDSEICLGEMYSPVEGDTSGLENATRARGIFEDVLKKTPNHPFALYNLAKLYLNGCGVPQDIARAKAMYKSARDVTGEIPEIEYKGKDLADWKEEEQGAGWTFVIVPVVVVAVFGLITAARFFKRRK